MRQIASKLDFLIEQALTDRQKVVLAIDGPCGSGKSTLADMLCRIRRASVIRCDDFFLPSAMRTRQRLEQIGGNVHYEALSNALSQIKNGDFSYMAYDCATDSFFERKVADSRVVIVEGSYALRSDLRRFYDICALLTIDKATQRERLVKREGDNYVNFENKWIPLEEKYFSCLDRRGCIVIDVSKGRI